MTIAQDVDLIAVAKSFAPQIEAAREESERNRSLPASLVKAMAEAGLFRAWVPKALGGFEADIETNLRMVEEVSKVDGAAGWNVMIAATRGMFSAFLPPETGREIYGDPLAITAGVTAPKGRAVQEHGGYRLSGRWPLASGCQHASWLAGGAFIFDGDKPLMDEKNGIPNLHLMFAPVRECEIIDTWHSGGLRGTGSHDFSLENEFIPAERTFSFLNTEAFYDGPLYRSGIVSIFGLPVSAVSLGIARTAIDALVALAGGKLPTLSRTMLRDRGTVQAQIAQAEALLRSARAFLFETVASDWETLLAGDKLSEEQEALSRLAAAHTAQTCAEVVRIVYTLGGATSVYTTSKLERCFRDVHVVTQHIAAAPVWYERAGQHFLGMGFPLIT